MIRAFAYVRNSVFGKLGKFYAEFLNRCVHPRVRRNVEILRNHDFLYLLGRIADKLGNRIFAVNNQRGVARLAKFFFT